MIKQASLALMAVALILVTGCGKTEIDRTIDQHYQVNFVKADNRAAVTAQIEINRQSVTFIDRSVLTANGIVDDLTGRGGNYFSWEIYDTSAITFRLRGENNTVIENVAAKSAIEDISIVMDSVLYVTDTMRLSFKGAPIGPDENVIVSMMRDNDSLGLWSGTTVFLTDRYCTLDFEQTKSFNPGMYWVLLTRDKQVPLQQTDGKGGGDIHLTITDRIMVEVK